MELLVKPQQFHLAQPTGSHQTVLQGQLVQVAGLVSHGQLLLLHLPVGDQLLYEHHQLGENKHRETIQITTKLKNRLNSKHLMENWKKKIYIENWENMKITEV